MINHIKFNEVEKLDEKYKIEKIEKELLKLKKKDR